MFIKKWLILYNFYDQDIVATSLQKFKIFNTSAVAQCAHKAIIRSNIFVHTIPPGEPAHA
jgi:hypothetical protein